MQFIILGKDGTDDKAKERREAARPEHIALGEELRQAGNMWYCINFSASFDIYTNGARRIFTSSMYHNLSSHVFIQSDNPNIVHVKKLGVTWEDFFKTLPMQLTKQCLITGTKQTFCTGGNGTLKFHINEVEDRDALDKQINEGDKLLVRFE